MMLMMISSTSTVIASYSDAQRPHARGLGHTSYSYSYSYDNSFQLPSNYTPAVKGSCRDAWPSRIVYVAETVYGAQEDSEYPRSCPEVATELQYRCVDWSYSDAVRSLCPVTCDACPDVSVAEAATTAAAATVAASVAVSVGASAGSSVGGAAASSSAGGGFGGAIMLLGQMQFISLLGMVSLPTINTEFTRSFAGFKWASLQFPDLVKIDGTPPDAEGGAATYLVAINANAKSLFWSSTVMHIIVVFVVVGAHLLLHKLKPQTKPSTPFPKFELVQFIAFYQGLSQVALIALTSNDGAVFALAILEILALNVALFYLARKTLRARREKQIQFIVRKRCGLTRFYKCFVLPFDLMKAKVRCNAYH